MQESRSSLPSWPLGIVLGGFMFWWAVGLVDVIWVISAVIMAFYLFAARGLRAPRGFGVWLVFIATMLASAIMLHTANRMIEFAFRGGTYLAATVVFVYVYNSRPLTDRRVTGLLTVYWLWVVLGGFLGLLLPNMRLRTPMFYILNTLSDRITGIGFINDMVVRKFAQYNPDSFLGTPARPAAPFLYANNWGSAYSLLLPFVVAYMIKVRGTTRFYALCVLVPISLVPAFLSLNRGMLIGLLISAVYVAGRLALRRKVLPLAVLMLGTLAAGLVFNAIAAQQLEARSADPSTGTRAYLYTESWTLTKESPLLGYGVPIQTEDPDKPPIGTQGQFWMVLVSNGIIATASFVLWLLIAWWRTRRRSDAVALAAAGVVLAGVVELFFYGMVPYGLPILMIAAALGMRSARSPARSLDPSAGSSARPTEPTAVGPRSRARATSAAR